MYFLFTSSLPFSLIFIYFIRLSPCMLKKKPKVLITCSNCICFSVGISPKDRTSVLVFPCSWWFSYYAQGLDAIIMEKHNDRKTNLFIYLLKLLVFNDVSILEVFDPKRLISPRWLPLNTQLAILRRFRTPTSGASPCLIRSDY